MDARDLIDRMRAFGVELYLEGDDLRYRSAPGKYTPEFRSQVQASKESIVAELRRRYAGACDQCGATEMTVMLEMSDGSMLCHRCWSGG